MNLVLVGFFHHRLVHEHSWSLTRDRVTGKTRWHRPNGKRCVGGPDPPGS